MFNQEPDEFICLIALVFDALVSLSGRSDASRIVAIYESNDGGHDTSDRQDGSSQRAHSENEPLRSGGALEEAVPPGLALLVLLTVPGQVHTDTLARRRRVDAARTPTVAAGEAVAREHADADVCAVPFVIERHSVASLCAES